MNPYLLAMNPYLLAASVVLWLLAGWLPTRVLKHYWLAAFDDWDEGYLLVIVTTLGGPPAGGGGSLRTVAVEGRALGMAVVSAPTDLAFTVVREMDPVERAIERLRQFAPVEGYWLAFSGGKDSQCIYHLAQEAGVTFEAHYNVTTADPPELVRFIRQHYPDVSFDRPELNMWQLIARERRPFTRMARYCCRVLKERGGEGRVVLTGVRRQESVRRRERGVVELNAYTNKGRIFMVDDGVDRQMVEACPIGSKHIVNPIIDWSERDVWQFIRSRDLAYCSLYDEGFTRLGCVACPYKSGDGVRQRAELRRWPHFRMLYLRAFERMLDERRAHNMPTTWTTAEEVLAWWVQEPAYPLWDSEEEPSV